MNNCKFDEAWAGKCNAKCSDDFCEEHSKLKCAICKKQATHTCNETGALVCGAPLCDNDECTLQHLYQSHGSAFLYIWLMEKKLNRSLSKLVFTHIAYINTNDSPGMKKVHDFLNTEYSGRITLCRIIPNDNGTVKICDTSGYCKEKSEISQIVQYLFCGERHQNFINEAGLYYSDSKLNILQSYPAEIINSFEKIV